MNNKSERISKAMKLIGKVTVDTLPDVLSLIPVIGIPHRNRCENIDWRS